MRCSQQRIVEAEAFEVVPFEAQTPFAADFHKSTTASSSACGQARHCPFEKAASKGCCWGHKVCHGGRKAQRGEEEEVESEGASVGTAGDGLMAVLPSRRGAAPSSAAARLAPQANTRAHG